MRAAVLSRDARAIYSVGLALNSSGFPGDGLNSVALMLAACQTGFDCSAANPEYGGSCVADGTCVEGERFEDMLQKNMGGETYARVFALAAEFRSALERHDSAAIEKFLARK